MGGVTVSMQTGTSIRMDSTLASSLRARVEWLQNTRRGVSTTIKMARTQRAAILTGESTPRVERVRSSKQTTHSLLSTNVWTAEASAYQHWHLTLTRSCCGWATWEVMSPPIMEQACSSTPASRLVGNI